MIAIGLKPCAAEIFGKAATTAFYIVTVIIMAIGPEVGALHSVFVLPDSIMIILVSIAAIMTLLAFCSYLPDVFRQFKSLKKRNKEK
mgnify:CR=1 FL=1